MKKIAFAVLALIGLSLIACGGKSGSGGSAGTKSKREPGTNANPDNLNPVGQLPVVKQQESFTLLIDDNGRPEEKILYNTLEKETNVQVNLMLYPYQAALERKNILLASGDYPDVIGGWLLTANDIMKLAKDETIIPLETLIDNYTVNIKAALALPGVRDAMTLPDGHIYSPPYVIEEPLVSFLPFINTKWLKQLNLKMPETTDEFKQVLLAFRDNIPNVNGQKIIPFSGDPNNLNLGTLAGWFGVNASGAGNNAGFVALIDGQLECTVIRPEYKAFLKYFADLYANNLVDPELFTQDNARWKAKGKQGLYGVSIAYGAGDFAEFSNPEVARTPWVLQYDYEALPVLKAPGVAKPVFRRNGFGVTTFRTQLVITDKAANPITIIRWLDNLYTIEHGHECDYGPIGVKFEKLSDGTYREIDITNWTEEEKKKYEWGMTWTTSMPKWRRGKAESPVFPPEGQLPIYDEKAVSDKLYEPYLETQPAPSLWYSETEGRRIADIETAVLNYVRQKQAEWVSGQANIDAEWDTYITQLDKLGLPEMMKIKRAAIR
ncbi:MAG: extracellular solute-binding protein [Spirochaetaceae bacterium]|jgi:putative aldouronate transport system substrate-binding protein|nr:extracellular solute-binding protein [Spirochaetaceae bacterium]